MAGRDDLNMPRLRQSVLSEVVRQVEYSCHALHSLRNLVEASEPRSEDRNRQILAEPIAPLRARSFELRRSN
jgi:hypothetical protein